MTKSRFETTSTQFLQIMNRLTKDDEISLMAYILQRAPIMLSDPGVAIWIRDNASYVSILAAFVPK